MSDDDKPIPDPAMPAAAQDADRPAKATVEIGGPKEVDPTRYGDWTVKGRCIDF